MKKMLLAAGCSLLLNSYAFAQGVGINDDNSSPDASAMLDVKSSNKGMLVPRMTTAQRIAIAAPATGLLVFDNTTDGFWYFDGTVWVPLLGGVDSDNQTLGFSGGTLSITGGNSVNLSGFANTDNQTMSLSGTNLSIARGNVVDLSSLVNDADNVVGNEYNNVFTLVGDNLILTDGGGSRTVSLAKYNSDNQTMNLSGTNLSIARGNTVSLAGLNTDNQTLSLSGTTLSIGRGNNVNLSGLINDADNVVGNEYNNVFTLVGDNLILTDGGGSRTVSLAKYNSDNQTMNLSGTNLSIARGNTVSLAGLNTDNQTLSLSGTTLSIGRGNNVNLSGLINDADNVVGNEYNNVFTLVGDNLILTDGGGSRTVSLAKYTSDNQTMSLLGTTLNIARGNSVNLSSLVNDADAVIGNEYNTAFALSGTNLTVTDGGGGRSVNLSSFLNTGRNGLRNVGNNVHLGGSLIENTTVTVGGFQMNFDLNSIGDFNIQDRGTNVFTVLDNGIARFGRGVEWRDGNTNGRLIAQLTDDGDDGRFRVMENGITSVDLDANRAFIFNEQGLDRDFRVESDRDINNFFVDAGTDRIGIGTGTPVQKLHVVGGARITNLGGTGTRMVVATNNGDLTTQPIAAITGVTAGTGLTGGGTTGAVTVNAVATNGLRTTANDIRLGGSLIENTTIAQGSNSMNFNLTLLGDFNIQDNGRNVFTVLDNSTSRFGGDVEWRDFSTTGTVLASLVDDGNDGRLRVMENGSTAVDLDANSQFIFNEQGLDRNFRVESDADANMLFVDAGTDRIGVGTGTPSATVHVLDPGAGTSATITSFSGFSSTGAFCHTASTTTNSVQRIVPSGNSCSGAGEVRLNFVAPQTGLLTFQVRAVSSTNPALSINGGASLISTTPFCAGNTRRQLTQTLTISVTQGVSYDIRLSANITGINCFSQGGILRLGNFSLAYSTPSAPLARFEGGGNVAVGDVGFANNNTYRFYVAGNAGATGGFSTASDKRFKTSIIPINGALNKIRQIGGYTYNFDVQQFPNKGFSEERQSGLIAQELKEVLPEAVLEDDEGYYSVNYDAVIPLLLEAMKEQQAQIESLENNNRDLESANSDLKASATTILQRLESIEQQLGIQNISDK